MDSSPPAIYVAVWIDTDGTTPPHPFREGVHALNDNIRRMVHETVKVATTKAKESGKTQRVVVKLGGVAFEPRTVAYIDVSEDTAEVRTQVQADARLVVTSARVCAAYDGTMDALVTNARPHAPRSARRRRPTESRP